jgi:hypothetical protein
MKNSRTRKFLVAAIVVIALAAMLAVVNSFGFSPDPSDTSTFMARAQQRSAPGIKVEASALGESESRRFFGENLARHNIQPSGSPSRTRPMTNSPSFPLQWTRITIHPTRLLIDFAA